MNRRRFLLTSMACAIPGALVAEGQPKDRSWRIGYLSLTSPDSDRIRGTFRRALRELRYVEGQTVTIHERHAAGQPEQLARLAAALVDLKVDVLVAVGDAAAGAAKNATQTIPIVMSPVADPVATGLVVSLARPGGNVTGVTDSHADLVAKRLGLLKDLAPRASRVAILFDPLSPVAPPQLTVARSAAEALGMTLLTVEVRGARPADFETPSSAIQKGRPDGLLVVAEPVVTAHRTRIADLAIRNRIPAIGTFRTWAEGGFLMSYGTDLDDLTRRAVVYVDRILKGDRPEDLPIEQPTKFELVINLKTATALGVAIPQSLRLRADRVVE